ncbi:oxidoreductase [Mycolicibacterium sp. GF69]|uniref:flavin reductase family protein n=1 Tax=Mycolicibacterium sp. GF69 TaxID=2267251 RepID=UPI000DCBBC50|nr:flavin reductase family protein [Mycolicibacterium sp. GF69]RAV08755.1 oxidoreductase [Mycolicibacterium sp. GF69]
MSEPQGTKAFEVLVGRLNYPMFVVTTTDGNELAGCLVGFASQTSINPPRFLIGLSKRNRTYRVAREATHLAVHIVSRHHIELAQLFGSETGDRVDKFDRVGWHSGPEGLPILDDAGAWFAGEIRRRFDVGDHVGHLLEPVAGQSPDDFAEWVTFADVRDLTPGHEA